MCSSYYNGHKQFELWEKNWGCNDYRNCMKKDCNFFEWLDDKIIDERDIKIGKKIQIE